MEIKRPQTLQVVVLNSMSQNPDPIDTLIQQRMAWWTQNKGHQMSEDQINTANPKP
jgi:hypothetical protein